MLFKLYGDIAKLHDGCLEKLSTIDRFNHYYLTKLNVR